jgi:repressor LexA
MSVLTLRQQQVLEFIRQCQRTTGIAPTVREIGRHFGFRSPTTVADHLRLLRRKGALTGEPGRARALRAVEPTFATSAADVTPASPGSLRRLPSAATGRVSGVGHRAVVDIPVFGAIPAGPPQRRSQESEGCLTVDVATLNVPPSPRLFALQVRGDSMTGRHILDGDLVVVEHGRNPKPGDVVAALIDGESTLKTFVQERGRPPCLRAENPRYPQLHPAQELVIQGVVVQVIRRKP